MHRGRSTIHVNRLLSNSAGTQTSGVPLSHHFACAQSDELPAKFYSVHSPRQEAFMWTSALRLFVGTILSSLFVGSAYAELPTIQPTQENWGTTADLYNPSNPDEP